MSDALTDALHEFGWHGLAPEQQDALINAGWHPGPQGGCGRRIKTGYCGVNGLCPRCWSERKNSEAALALETAISKIEAERRRAAREVVSNGSHWEDRSQGIVAGLDVALTILREASNSQARTE